MTTRQAHTKRSDPRDREYTLRRAASEYLRLLAEAGYIATDDSAMIEAAAEFLRGLDQLPAEDTGTARVLGADFAARLPRPAASSRFVGPLTTALLLAAPQSPADAAAWAQHAGCAAAAYAEVLTEQALGQHEAILRAAVAAREHRISELQDRLHYAATHDRLTGLANRAVLEEWIGAPRATAETVSILLVDLDGFKQVNDTHGHHVGDELLVAVADRLRAVAQADDCVCRYGGDEFVIATIAGNTTAQADADRILCDIARPFALSTGDVHIRASIGIATDAPGNHDAPALIHAADRAMYVAKSGGGQSYRVQD